MGQKKLIRRKRFKKSQQRDFDFFMKNRHKFTFSGVDLSLVPKGEYSVFDCFILWDTQGKLLPCENPELLRQIMVCKKSVNFHIKMWVEGYDDMGMPISEYLKEFIDPPEWVYKSFRGQLKRKFLKRYPHLKWD